MSLCTLVDRDDSIIGYKERDQLAPGDIYRISALWVLNSQHQLLLTQRALTKKNDPGRWSVAVGGTIENKESYEENIIKEAREELGIEDVTFQLGSKIFVSDNGYGRGYFCQTFTVTLDWPIERFHVQPEEVAAVQWFDIDDVRLKIRESPDMFPAAFPRALDVLLADTQLLSSHN